MQRTINSPAKYTQTVAAAEANKMWTKALTIVILFQSLLVTGRVASAAVVKSRMAKDTFLYFAYGSNLLGKRIHIQNPTAVRRGIGRLKDYRLDFSHYANRWNGAPSTIVPDPGREVWGAIWEISIENFASLDSQEGVHNKVYRPIKIAVETAAGSGEECRVYILCENPGLLEANQETTSLPSETYINVIIAGAIESGLPEEYIQWLKTVKHNGRQAIPELVQALNDHLTLIDQKTTPPRSPLLPANSFPES